jgi:glucose-6-phosphate dehydrogenase assembly protein OpcA
VNSSPSELLPAGADVSFNTIGEAMARGTCQDSGATPMRALVATVVAVGPTDRLGAAAEALQSLGDAGTVRGILISEGDSAAPPARVAGNTVAFHGLKPSFFNNAVAALRLSSLPTLVWWRGGRPDTLDGLADLADRIVLDDDRPMPVSLDDDRPMPVSLDDDRPDPIWSRAVTLFEDSAFSDLRWARLTQWRALMAHFFDIPEVQAAAADFSRLTIAASDRMSARLFAAWLQSSIQFRDGFTVDVADGSQGTPIDEVRLGDHEQELVIRFAAQRTCLETEVSVRGHRSASRLVSLGDQTLTALITEELRIRARDAAFERALVHLVSDR